MQSETLFRDNCMKLIRIIDTKKNSENEFSLRKEARS